MAGKATFIEGDMYTADISKATVMALFLLPDNLGKLRDKFMDLRPGSRLVLNTFGIPDWEADARETINDTVVRAVDDAARAGARPCSTTCQPRSAGPGKRRRASSR